MADTQKISEIVEPVVEAMGFKLVRVKMMGGEDEPTLQIMAERPDTRQLTIEDCADISRALDEPLEAADPIDHAYRLEVSSPGIDRPLTRLTDYTDWQGHLARITLEEKLDGRKKFKGDLAGVNGENVLIDIDETVFELPFAAIEDAKLLFTDKLLQETQPLSTEGAEDIEEDTNG
ncbi:ribosome maturation protein RimP [Sphingomicrobium sediminis]|uniref:Ribosome maturation factor RimP n=1 Tax=Sphingomicrobium sediminis TaxID=2950949 RepID=A0A9X2EEU9_9SPHN|nr:ribosome maturation protein RimP [Sphingomicrobium sediminis]MCM8556295.1 ribosome maturation protein RimP [Sphingomicrobium sediminis]